MQQFNNKWAATVASTPFILLSHRPANCRGAAVLSSVDRSPIHLLRKAIETGLSHSLAGRAGLFGNIRVHMTRQVGRPSLCASVAGCATGSKVTPVERFTAMLSSVIVLYRRYLDRPGLLKLSRPWH